MIGFDLGSNTLRAVKIACDTKQRIAAFEQIVGTARGVESSGRISEEAVARVVNAVIAAKTALQINPTDPIKAVATAAMRKASNSQAILTHLHAQTDISFEVIDGLEESRLTLLGVTEALRQKGCGTQSQLIIDLGGGSTELILTHAEGYTAQSFDIGIITATEKPAKRAVISQIRAFVQAAYAQHGRPMQMVATAGTPTTLAAFIQGIDYAGYDYQHINGFALTTVAIQDAAAKLERMDEAKREQWVGVGRAPLIRTGIALLLEMMAACDFTECIVIDEGLREGAALQACLQNALK